MAGHWKLRTWQSVAIHGPASTSKAVATERKVMMRMGCCIEKILLAEQNLQKTVEGEGMGCDTDLRVQASRWSAACA
jgi:hypothetical protein